MASWKINVSVIFLAVVSFFYVDTDAGLYESPVINKYGHRGLFYSHSAKTLGMGRLSAGLNGTYGMDKKYFKSVLRSNGDTLLYSDSTLFQPDLHVLTGRAFLGYGLTRYIDLSFMMPLYWEHVEEDTRIDSDFDGSVVGYGDLEASVKFQYPPYPHRNFFEMAYYGALSFPTGEDQDAWLPRHAYYDYKDQEGVHAFQTSSEIEIDMKMLWTFDFGVLDRSKDVEAHINYGIRWTQNKLDHLFLLNLGLEYHPIKYLKLFTEFSGETRLANVDRGFDIGEDPLRLSPGFTVTPPGGFFFTVGMDIDLSSDSAGINYTTSPGGLDEEYQVSGMIEPQWAVSVSMGWAGFILPQDADQDGIKDNVDECPNDPEDFDGFQDDDGCPDEDNDGDGIPDTKDKCPNSPEDFDGFEDEDGCPDSDNDGDGVSDSEDECPDEPEDFDGFEDEDGCPDKDNDGDGIPDSVDGCPDEAEDMDGFQDEDGCPDYDNDRDGIADSVDECPDEPEDMDGFEDEDGCPDTDNDDDGVPDTLDRCPDTPGAAENDGCPDKKPKAKKLKRGRIILRGVNFETDKAVLTEESFITLDRVVQSLKEWPDIRIRIEGHTDSVGNRIYNNRLSRKRAEAVRDYFVQQGISPDRLESEGKGEDDPIASNKTAKGRARNRRVELHRID